MSCVLYNELAAQHTHRFSQKMTGSTETRERKIGVKQTISKKELRENTATMKDGQEKFKSGDDDINTQTQKGRDIATQNRSNQNKISGQDRQHRASMLSVVCSKAKYFFLIIFVPPFLNYVALQREAVELKPPGELFDIGWGQKLFLSCQGKGPPTIVLDAPTGMSSDVWTLVVPKLAEHANVCIYDRAGLGFSDRPMNRSRAETDITVTHLDHWKHFTVERMVDDLHKLITSSSQQPRPLIFVGAELGALVAQFFSHLYESDVIGLVLVSPLHEDLFEQFDSVWVQHWFGSLNPTYQTLQLGAALGITRIGLLTGALKQPITGQSVSNDVILRQKHLLCHPRHLSSVVDEHFFINETFSQMRTLRKIKSLAPHISVSVLTGNYYDEQMSSLLNKAWARAEQSLLSRLSPSVQHLVVNGADHQMMFRKPEPIIDAVLKIVRKWKRLHTFGGSQSA